MKLLNLYNLRSLVNAVQEQQGQIEELKVENTELRSLIGQINARLTALAQ